MLAHAGAGDPTDSRTMADHPLTSIPYRIQQVDCETYVELSREETPSEGKVGLRQLKNSQYQHWEFEKDDKSNDYFIRSTVRSDLYLYFDASYLVFKAYPKTKVSVQPFRVSTRSHEFSTMYSTTRYYFQAKDGYTASATSTATGLDDQRWKLVPVTLPPVKNPWPLGYYRIRSLSGTSLLTMPSGQQAEQPGVYVKQQIPGRLPGSAFQRWRVTPLPNGKFTISNAGNSLHLGCGPSQSAFGDNVIGIEGFFEWDLESFGGFAWSIRIPETDLSVGVADFEVANDDMITLARSDSTSSQIWFFEKYVPIGQDEIHAKQEVEAGTYLLQNAHDPTKYASASTTSPPYLGLDSNMNTKFKLEYVDDSAKFTLTYTTKGLPVADTGGKLGFNNKPTEFVLLEKSAGDPGFYICRPDAGSPRQVVSGRLVKDAPLDKNVLAVDNMEEGEPLQMWNLIAV